MLELVSIADARLQLRTEGANDDGWLAIFIPAISQAVAEWLKESWRLYVPLTDPDGTVVIDSSGDPIPDEDSNGPIVKPVVRAAVLVELSSQYRYREGEGANVVAADAGHGYVLSKGATALLAALRKSTIA